MTYQHCPKRNSGKNTAIYSYQQLNLGTPRACLRSTWVDASTKSLEAPQTTDYLQRALITIAYAIANPCKLSGLSYDFSANISLDKVDWDVMRFADRVKNTRPRPNGEPAIDDLNLEKFFTNPELGDLHEPATIVDIFGRIMVWYLPDILHPSLIVGPVHLLYLLSESNLSSS